MSNILFIDTETTGLDPSRHGIIQLGAVCQDGVLGIYIRPDGAIIDREAMEINKIDLDMVERDGFSLPLARREFYRFLDTHYDWDERVILGGFNLPFDIQFLRKIIPLDDWEMRFSHRTIDVCSVMQFLSDSELISRNPGSLKKCLQYFGLPSEGLHDAVTDAMATKRLYETGIKLVRAEYNIL